MEDIFLLNCELRRYGPGSLPSERFPSEIRALQRAKQIFNVYGTSEAMLEVWSNGKMVRGSDWMIRWYRGQRVAA